MLKSLPMKQQSIKSDVPKDVRSPFIRRAGTILAISYPILALSTGFRSLYQLFLKEEIVSYVGPALTFPHFYGHTVKAV
jgi:hypothetical protein